MTIGVQTRVGQWVLRCFGAANSMNRRERAMRLVEEALEVAQLEGIDRESLARVIARVYDRPVGAVRSEIGGVGITWMAYAEACGEAAMKCVEDELRRINNREGIDRCRLKHAEKRLARVTYD